MASPRSTSLASLRICVLQLPALLRRGAEPPAGTDAAAVTAWVFEKKLLQMRRIEEALCRTLELLKKRSAAEGASPFAYTFRDNLLPAAVHSAAAVSSSTQNGAPFPDSTHGHNTAAAAAAWSSSVRSCLERLSAATAGAPPPFDLLVLPEMWSSPYHSSCFSRYAEELPACVDGSDSRNQTSSPRPDATGLLLSTPPRQQVLEQKTISAVLASAAAGATPAPAAAAAAKASAAAGAPPAAGGPPAAGTPAEHHGKTPSACRRSPSPEKCGTADQSSNSSTTATEGGDLRRGSALPASVGGEVAGAAVAADAGIAASAAEDMTARIAASPAFAFMQDLARRLRVFIVGGSLVERLPLRQQERAAAGGGRRETAAGDSAGGAPETVKGHRLYNTCCVFDPRGRFITKYRKSHLFDVNILKEEDPNGKGIVFQESAVLSAGKALGSFSLPPFGNVGIGICYDLRFPEYALALAQQRQCSLLCYPGAFNQTTGPPHWSLLLRGRALDNQLYVVGCSPASPTATAAAEAARGTASAGKDAAVSTTAKTAGQSRPAGEYPCYGHSMVVGPWGDVIAQLEGEPGVIVVTAAAQRVCLVRKQIPIYRQKRFNEVYSKVSEISPPRGAFLDHSTTASAAPAMQRTP